MYSKENMIPIHSKCDKRTTRLLYSRKYCPDYKPAGKLDKPLIGTGSGFEVWDSQADDDGHVAKCLVMCYDCPDLIKRHKELMKEHGASYDFDEYKPHITFSYDINDGADIDKDELPKFATTIEIVEEYGEDLNLDWAKDNSDITEKKDK